MDITHIQLKNIKKSFIQGDLCLDVLEDISFVFQKGMSYALIGVSGTGKSTLLHIIAGLDEPTGGMVYFNDIPYTQLNIHQKESLRNRSLGMIFQTPYLIDELTVIENVMMKGLLGGLDKKFCYQEARSLLSQVGLSDKENCHPSELSSGQQQRVAIARALLNKPDFIIADEPTGSVDAGTAQEIVELLCVCTQELSIGLIMSSHDMNIAEHMGMILQLNQGSLAPYHPFVVRKE